MAKMNLEKLSVEELESLKNDVDKMLRKKEAERLEEARKEVQQRAKDLGFSLSDLVGGKKGKGSGLPPKYQHPTDKSKTWSGRGRRPQWVKDAIAQGKSLDDLAIA